MFKLTWMKTVAGDLGALQFLCQLMGEENVAQLAVAVDFGVIDCCVANPQLLVSAQTIKIDGAKMMKRGSHVDHSTGSTLLQTVQQQDGQQEGADVVNTKHHAQAILSLALDVDPLHKIIIRLYLYSTFHTRIAAQCALHKIYQNKQH